MSRCSSCTAQRCALLLLSVATLCAAGPIGSFPNATSSELGMKDGACQVGDVVYLPGDEFPGARACERCTCARAAVTCARERCEPRAGCKALHRPDHCCPIYQCECEQEGRVYGNGEKLVDPRDPCRVCYCQGGEVVCRRIACFVRDDCRPRPVPGRCCPEYDNCPLRGVTTIPGAAPTNYSMSTVEDIGSSPAPAPPKESVKQEITIKEITRVSEIPIITDVKIKEILPSPGIEVPEYSSSKSPLIVREATSEKSTSIEDVHLTPEAPFAVEVQPSWSPDIISSSPSEVSSTKSESFPDAKITNDSPPSKISFSTQDSINSEIYPSILTSVPTMGSPPITPDVVVVPVATTTKTPVIEEEYASILDHNPFPPLPDDFSVSGNHEDEITQEQTVDGEHISMVHERTSSATPSTEAVSVAEPLTTTVKDIPETTAETTTKFQEIPTDFSTAGPISTSTIDSTTLTEAIQMKHSPMLNLRSAIPTEVLNVPSLVPEEITGELDEVTEIITASEEPKQILTSTTTQSLEDKYTQASEVASETSSSPTSTMAAETTTFRATETTVPASSTQNPLQEPTTVSKSEFSTEVTSQTELSSLPVETSDQNPHDSSEIITREKAVSSTIDTLSEELTTPKMASPIESEVITVSRAVPSSTDNQSFENVETTEFILTSFGSSESATDAVELIKISADPEKSAAIIEPEDNKKTNLLTDLINLVGDVASIGDHTESPGAVRHVTVSGNIPESEELIPINAGYKSKNNNWNVNSITEIPVKSKSQAPVHKQKNVEIEGEDTDDITDSAPPFDKVEPTTRRPTIDNVSDDVPQNRTEKKDIEIITKSYVPTINRRPSKVVMKKNNEKPLSADRATEGIMTPVSVDRPTEGIVTSVSAEAITESTAASAPSESVSTAEPDAGTTAASIQDTTTTK